jgi:glucose/arabinose dehydrogenase
VGGRLLRRSALAVVPLVVAVGALVGAGALDPGPSETSDEPFVRGQLDYVVELPTVLAWGPDDRLYVATVDGAIEAIELSADGAVTGVDVIAEAGENGAILGMAFDPMSPDPVLYVAENFIEGTSNGDPFPNRIIRYRGDSLSERDVAISGLPVSGHNHGTNALAFDGEGRLYIAQGGATSAGVPSALDDPRWLGWDETPLSGAVLVADVNAPGFDGEITYDRREAVPETNVVSGDVEVWSLGHRNTFTMVFHSNGNLYAIDNGSSEPFPASADCETDEPPPVNEPDQLNLVVEGAYYGHPNRNRARTNPEECFYVSPRDEQYTSGDHMVQLVPASSDALIEFGGGAFGGVWDGDLIYAWFSGGEVRRLALGPDGETIDREEIVASGFVFPVSMVQGPDGTIYIAEYAGGVVSYLKPDA